MVGAETHFLSTWSHNEPSTAIQTYGSQNVHHDASESTCSDASELEAWLSSAATSSPGSSPLPSLPLPSSESSSTSHSSSELAFCLLGCDQDLLACVPFTLLELGSYNCGPWGRQPYFLAALRMYLGKQQKGAREPKTCKMQAMMSLVCILCLRNVSVTFPKRFLRVSQGFPKGFPRVS